MRHEAEWAIWFMITVCCLLAFGIYVSYDVKREFKKELCGQGIAEYAQTGTYNEVTYWRIKPEVIEFVKTLKK